MDALTALHSRVSVPILGDPAPDEDSLDNIFKAALRAPDHLLLRPWRFLVVRGDAREKLGDIFRDIQKQDLPDTSEALLEKTWKKPLRAPLLVVAIAHLQEHENVPEIEQVLSTGAAVQNMMICAHAQGYGAMWRTGTFAYHANVAKRLGLAGNERIVGFLYLGTIAGRIKSLPNLQVEDFFKEWT